MFKSSDWTIRLIMIMVSLRCIAGSSFYAQNHHDLTQLKASDPLCNTTNTVNLTCTLTNKTIVLKSDFVYNATVNLVLDNMTFTCFNSSGPCSIIINMNNNSTSRRNLTLRRGSQLQGRQIIVMAQNSAVSLMENSIFNASGQSHSSTGTGQRSNVGASFVGEGGACSETTHQTYGNYSQVPNFMSIISITHAGSQIGSMGNISNTQTSGGGRIVITADSLFLNSSSQQLAQIQANARPFTQNQNTNNLAGGSGGYIYITTSNKFAPNIINTTGVVIEAKGGFGNGNAFGGSGGMILLDGNFTVNNLDVTTNAAGGSAFSFSTYLDSCSNGAAGTVYNVNDKALYISNKGIPTARRTHLVPLFNNNTKVNPTMIGKNVSIQGNARILIQGTSEWVYFDNLQLNSSSSLALNSSNTQVYLQLSDRVQFSTNSQLDFSLLPIMSINATENSTVISLPDVIYGRVFKIFGGQVKITGSIKLLDATSEATKQTSYFLVNSESITLVSSASILAGHILLHAEYQVKTSVGSKISSYINNTCNLEPKKTLFSCVPFKFFEETINQTTFLKAFNQKFHTDYFDFFDTMKMLTSNYTIYIVSFVNITVQGTKLQGSRIGFCAPDIYLNQSTVNSSGQGCPSGQGIGAGASSPSCAGSGGSHGGFGGSGTAYSPNKEGYCPDLIQGPYYSQGEAVFEGSGGGSGLSNATELGGNGGGIVWFSSTGILQIQDSLVTAQGQNGLPGFDGKFGSGGGAGGSVQIVTKNLAGNSDIKLSGGDGSMGGGGGGAGGRLGVNFLQAYNVSNQYNQSQLWSGTLDIAGGHGGRLFIYPGKDGAGTLQPTEGAILVKLKNKNHPITRTQTQQFNGDGQSGTASATKCFGGYIGPFCQPCPIGTFKYDFGYGTCQSCKNKPKDAFYYQIAESNHSCAYQCSSGLENSDLNPQCETSLALQIKRFGGHKGTLIIMGLFLAFSLIVFVMIFLRSQCITRLRVNAYETAFFEILSTKNMLNQRKNKLQGESDIRIRDQDIFCHNYRMYLIGSNSISFPWYIPKNFPNDTLQNYDRDRLLQFIQCDQGTLDWSICQRQIYYLFRLFFPYMSDWIHRAFRRSHFRNASKSLYQQFEASHWENPFAKTVRFTCDSQNCQLAYLDFFDFSQKIEDYGGPQLPLTLLLAGDGSLSTPYKLNFTEDPLAKSIVFLDKNQLQNKLPPFFENLNTLLDKLSFYKFNRQTMKDLSDIIEWIEIGNKTIFNPLDTQLTLYLFENSYQDVEGGSFKQRRRSMPLESLVFEAFPSIFKSLIQFVQLKLLNKKSEIRFGLVLKPTTVYQRRRLQEKVNKLVQAEYITNKKRKSFVSLMYDSDDQERKTKVYQQKVTGQQKGTLKNLIRQKELETAQLNESRMEESEVLIHGELLGTHYKMIDKSKRAFEISYDSSRALEIALGKNRKKCSNCCIRLKSVFYSTWLMFFKSNGKPPGPSGLNFWFLVFSLVYATEILLTLILLLHFVNPIANLYQVGIPYLLVLPGITIIAPIWCLLAILFGSPQMMKSFSNMNSTMLLMNYPLTLISMLITKEKTFYIFVVCLLILNKVAISSLGAKVRQHFANPQFSKTQYTTQDLMRNMVVATSQKLLKSVNQAERASILVSSGRPSMVHSSLASEYTESEYDVDIVDDSDEDDDSFGIISTNQLRAVSSKPKSDYSNTQSSQGRTITPGSYANPNSDDDDY